MLEIQLQIKRGIVHQVGFESLCTMITVHSAFRKSFTLVPIVLNTFLHSISHSFAIVSHEPLC